MSACCPKQCPSKSSCKAPTLCPQLPISVLPPRLQPTLSSPIEKIVGLKLSFVTTTIDLHLSVHHIHPHPFRFRTSLLRPARFPVPVLWPPSVLPMLLGSTVRTYFWRLVSGAPAASVTTITKGELSTTTMASFEQTVDDLIAKPVAVFSKSYCPYVNFWYQSLISCLPTFCGASSRTCELLGIHPN
jgi:hypothetical protein